MSGRGTISGLVAGVSFVAGIGGAMARSTPPSPHRRRAARALALSRASR